ncbi:hypothetical protein ACT0L1_004378 [Vibrio vulnificus]|uniref:hypothetical protein n=1 Tax=Vibrio sp. CCUG 15886 TaxID=3025223 RepID=UPI00235904CE|nr:hypothetical protein [Vibrio sp. CCUG 15886]ELS3558303.1 hypothetical protein [Vibrio vulnificus]MDC8111546.1 hypothetical protein [Vibrio sp. CCUG 15886]
MKTEIRDYFNSYIDSIDGGGGSGAGFELPAFELMPRDFVSFAENDLSEEMTAYQLVNATSNLKRAMDCNLDYLLSVLNLDALYRAKRLGVDRKLGFFKHAGVFNGRSLEKLNKFRNRLEHHYEIPDVKDVDVYFDLIAAFVTIGESFISQIRSMSDVELCVVIDDFKDISIKSEITLEQPAILLQLEQQSGEPLVFEIDLQASNKPNVENILEFAYLLKLHTLLIHLFHGSVTKKRFLDELEAEI